MVIRYLERSGLDEYLDKLRFNLVGYGYAIGNSGPYRKRSRRRQRQRPGRLVLSGNRNFEGRPGYPRELPRFAALGGCLRTGRAHGHRPEQRSVGKDSEDEPVYLSDVWPSNDEIKQAVGDAVRADMFTKSYADVFTGDERWRGIQVPEDDRYTWPDSTYVRKPTSFEGMPAEPKPVEPIEGARVLAVLGDSVTTDHISPAGRSEGQPRREVAARSGRRGPRLQLLWIASRQPRGDGPRDLRQRPAPQRARREGGRFHPSFPRR